MDRIDTGRSYGAKQNKTIKICVYKQVAPMEQK